MAHTSSDEAYRQSGVDLKRAEAVVDIAKKAAHLTPRDHLLGGIGGFSGAFEIPPGYTQPVMLSACDGVGTKLKIAFMANQHNTVGIDLVAMSVNDLLVNGGQPLVFLDYFACDEIRPEILTQVLEGVAVGCEQSGCSLAGGETAEMPGMYQSGEFDLAGFAVGVVEKQSMLPQLDLLEPGDVLIGLKSSGLHSNGYSLVRKILFQDHNLSLQDSPEELDGTLGEALLAPTQIYVKPVLSVLKALPQAVKAMVHVTGGGFYDNIPRVLPSHLSAHLESNVWEMPPIFKLLKRLGNLDNPTLYHTFNCGIGYILVTRKESAQPVIQHIRDLAPELSPMLMGSLENRNGNASVVIQ